MAGRLAGDPDARAGSKLDAANGGDERVAGRRARRQVVPLDRGARMVGQREPAVGLSDLDAHLHGRPGGYGVEQLADRGDRGFVTTEQERARVAVDGVTATGPGDRSRVARLGRLRPLRRDPAAVHDDLEIELERLGIDAIRREGPDRGASTVGHEELVAVPARHDELVSAGRRQEQSNARRRILHRQPVELRAGQRHADHARPTC